MAKANKHVVPNVKGGWNVRSSGASRATKAFDTKRDAVTYARVLARKEATELFVHKRDGTISERDTYGRDPYPPKSKR